MIKQLLLYTSSTIKKNGILTREATVPFLPPVAKGVNFKMKEFPPLGTMKQTRIHGSYYMWHHVLTRAGMFIRIITVFLTES